MTAKSFKLAAYYARFEQWRGKYFPERQLFLRSQGRVRFLTIHSYTQIAITTSLMVAIGWGAVTSYAYLSRDQVIEGKNRTISTMSTQYKTLSNDFSALEAEVERRAQQLEERQNFLEEMLEEEHSVSEITLPAESETADTPATMTMPVARETAAPEQQSSLIDRFFSGASVNASTVGTLERRSALLARLRNLEQRQRNMAGALLENVNTRIAFVDDTLASSNLKTDDLLEKMTPETVAVGGPYIPELGFDGVFDEFDGMTFVSLQEKSQRLKMVTNALDSYPIGKPAEKFYLSSRFGRRRDPIKKTWAHHSGLDLAGWPGTPITATAPGKVVYSGWFGPYGNMVEIDHGNGFRTRYGHMKKLRVKKNENVILGQQLGDMGKTGRVTGTHVHYEVWFDGKLKDPMPFMKAAKNVLKIQGRYEETNEQS